MVECELMSGDEAKNDLVETLEHQQRFDSRLTAIDAIDQFDATFGVETNIPLENWEIEESTDYTLKHNSRYSPTPVRTIRRVLAEIPIPPENTAFVDFGSGKGRVLLAASELPFKRVIGVDYSSTLCATARDNIARYSSRRRQTLSIDVLCQDATLVPIPHDAGCFYFYEPFSAAVTEVVLHNIEESLRRQPREAAICLVGNALKSTVDARPFWTTLTTVTSPDHPYYDATIYVPQAVHHRRSALTPSPRRSDH